jgi:hypothetical protein
LPPPPPPPPPPPGGDGFFRPNARQLPPPPVPGGVTPYPTPSYGYSTPVSDDPLVPHDFGSWINKVFATVGRSWKALGIIHLLVFIPQLILGLVFALQARNVVNDPADPAAIFRNFGRFIVPAIVVGIFSFVTQSVASVASSHVISHDAARPVGAPLTDWRAGLRFGWSRIGRMIGWSIATSLLSFVGFLLCLAPGLWFAVIFYATLAFSQIVGAVVGVPVAMLRSASNVVTYAELRSKQQFVSSAILAAEAT